MEKLVPGTAQGRGPCGCHPMVPWRSHEAPHALQVAMAASFPTSQAIVVGGGLGGVGAFTDLNDLLA